MTPYTVPVWQSPPRPQEDEECTERPFGNARERPPWVQRLARANLLRTACGSYCSGALDRLAGGSAALETPRPSAPFVRGGWHGYAEHQRPECVAYAGPIGCKGSGIHGCGPCRRLSQEPRASTVRTNSTDLDHGKLDSIAGGLWSIASPRESGRIDSSGAAVLYTSCNSSPCRCNSPANCCSPSKRMAPHPACRATCTFHSESSISRHCAVSTPSASASEVNAFTSRFVTPRSKEKNRSGQVPSQGWIYTMYSTHSRP